MSGTHLLVNVHLVFRCVETWEKVSLWKIGFSRTVGQLSNEKNPRCSKGPHFPYPHAGISRSKRSNFGRDTVCSRVGFAACCAFILRSRNTARRRFRSDSPSCFPLPGCLLDTLASMAGENWIQTILFRHRFQHRVPESPDQTAAKRDHREGSGQIGAQSPSHRSQSGRHYRARDSRTAAIGCRFGYHLGFAISRYSGWRQVDIHRHGVHRPD